MKITQEMVMELNKELLTKGVSFRFEFVDNGRNPHIEIALPSMNFVSNFIINPTAEFYSWLELWFKIKGIELSSNNTGSVLWSKSGWDNN